MAQSIELFVKGETISLDHFDKVVIRVRRTAKVVKGGKRFTFSALAVVGNRKGRVGWGYGKANEVPFAMEKAFKDAARRLVRVSLSGTTIPHAIEAKFSATRVILRPACPGTGIKAGLSARGVLEMAGVKDVLTKVSGSTNPLNVVKATYEALSHLKLPKELGALRNVQISPPKAKPATAVPHVEGGVSS